MCYYHQLDKKIIDTIRDWKMNGKEIKFCMKKDASMLFSEWLYLWLSGLYYVWKSCKQTGTGILYDFFDPAQITFSFDDICQWEMICEDEKEEVFAHPLLPHPSDFLTKNKDQKMSDLYADKARFRYQFPRTLDRYIVVLTKNQSIIPRLSSRICQEEKVCWTGKKETCERRPYFFHASTKEHRKGIKKRKKFRSHVLKETRKQNKKKWRVCKADVFFHENEEYVDLDLDVGDDDEEEGSFSFPFG